MMLPEVVGRKTAIIYEREKKWQERSVRLAKVARKYTDSLASDSKAKTSLLGAYLDFSDLNPPPSVNDGLGSLEKTFKSIELLTQQLTIQLQAQVTALGEFNDFAFAETKYTKRQVAADVEAFKSLTSKDHGKMDDQKVVSLAEDIRSKHTAVMREGTKFAEACEYLQVKKEIQLLQQMSTIFDTHAWYHRKAAALFDAISPDIQKLNERLKEARAQQSFVQKEGLLQLRKGPRGPFTPEWVVIKNSRLLSFKSEKDYNPETALNLSVCAAKPDMEKRTDFVIHSPGKKKPIEARAPSEAIRNEWVKELQSGIGASLQQDFDKTNTTWKTSAMASINEKIASIILSVPGNTYCADCDTENPSWASINLGVVLCLECSGVHRSLGSHISKVRSLELDYWEADTVLYMTKLGNVQANHLFERCLNHFPGFDKPSSTSPRNNRERYIQAKYRDKKFLPPITSSFNLEKRLHELCGEDGPDEEVLSVMMLIFYGVDTNSCQDGTYPLIQAVINDKLLITMALTLNGADVTAGDDKGWTAFHWAAYHNHYHCLSALLKASARDPNAVKDNLGETPLCLAERWDRTESIVLLKGGSLPRELGLGAEIGLMDEDDKEEVPVSPRRTRSATDTTESFDSENVVWETSHSSVPDDMSVLGMLDKLVGDADESAALDATLSDSEGRESSPAPPIIISTSSSASSTGKRKARFRVQRFIDVSKQKSSAKSSPNIQIPSKKG